MQLAVAARLLTLGAFLAPKKTLAAGVGAGAELSLLRRQFPAAELTAMDFSQGMLRIAKEYGYACVCADLEKLPFRDAAFDLVFSNLCLHWCNAPEVAVSECRRSLRREGALLLSVCGSKTLYELSSSWQSVEGKKRTLDFPNKQFVMELFKQNSLRIRNFWTQREIRKYDSFNELLTYLRACGLRDAPVSGARSAVSRVTLREVEKYYQRRWSRGGKIAATYEYYLIFAEVAKTPS